MGIWTRDSNNHLLDALVIRIVKQVVARDKIIAQAINKIASRPYAIVDGDPEGSRGTTTESMRLEISDT